MRLEKLYISEYKNLKDFVLEFDNDSFIDIFVGKNGSGKSNLFEAIIQIFRHLDQFDSRSVGIDFDYEIRYKINSTRTRICWENGQLLINDRKRKTFGKTPIPDQALVYYSGHNETVTHLINSYDISFQQRIKSTDLSDRRFLLGIGPKYKKLLLVAILLKPVDNPCRKFICKKLGIKEVENCLTMTLKRPLYARGKK